MEYYLCQNESSLRHVLPFYADWHACICIKCLSIRMCNIQEEWHIRAVRLSYSLGGFSVSFMGLPKVMGLSFLISDSISSLSNWIFCDIRLFKNNVTWWSLTKILVMLCFDPSRVHSLLFPIWISFQQLALPLHVSVLLTGYWRRLLWKELRKFVKNEHSMVSTWKILNICKWKCHNITAWHISDTWF